MANAQLNTITLDGMQAIYPIRNEVAEFAIKMERVLQANDHKSGWDKLGIDEVFLRVSLKFHSFRKAYTTYSDDGGDHYMLTMLNELVDIANYCMFFCHNFHATSQINVKEYYSVDHECKSIVGGGVTAASCSIRGAPIAELTEEDSKVLRNLLILAIKELGEIAECVVKGDPNAHWKNELGDLCGLVVKPMLELAQMQYLDACEIGIDRKEEKTNQ